MAASVYMSIIGAKSGEITKGNSTVESMGNDFEDIFQDKIVVQSFQHEISTAYNLNSGHPAGQKLPKPLIITKTFDKSSPLLQQALSSGERLTEVVLRWYRPTRTSDKEHYYTTVLKDAVIVSIRDYMHDIQNPTTEQSMHMEEVHFNYRDISWTHEICGTSGTYSWGS
ncbi:Hcp family type VI secretion system effector [Pseudomonas sp. NPDC089734]|uniref:Hcp family type VI secretion system effector n=1 Tax=Pseudomonas sp. NPDC089734 TaxID=3364469 RepID=UPI003827036B